jgi:putative endonuclease
MFYVYLIRSEVDNGLYIGYTENLKRRFEEHNSGLSKSTKLRAPFEMIYCEAYKSKTDAIKRERNLKKFKNSYTQLKKRIENSLL